MKKLILIALLSLSPNLFSADIGVRIITPIGNNGILDVGFRDDDHRHDNRYRNFDYNSYGYYDNFGYYYGYFDRTGYFFNNIFFLYDNRYTYYDRLHRRGFFRPAHPHYREYIYHKKNDWNRNHEFRDNRQPIYGPYYDKQYVKPKFKPEEKRPEHRQYNDRNFHDNKGQRNINPPQRGERQYQEEKGFHR